MGAEVKGVWKRLYSRLFSLAATEFYKLSQDVRTEYTASPLNLHTNGISIGAWAELAAYALCLEKVALIRYYPNKVKENQEELCLHQAYIDIIEKVDKEFKIWRG